jgi:O-6-methylguanine DNA methyltransferase
MATSINKAQVYNLLSKIPAGQVTTYGEIARKMKIKAYRAIGAIVGANPDAPRVPCHRVVRSDASVSGYAFGVDKKIALLKKEGVLVENGKIKNFAEKFYKF